MGPSPDEKAHAAQQKFNRRERLEKAGWECKVDDDGDRVGWHHMTDPNLQRLEVFIPMSDALVIENYKDEAVKEAAEKIRAENERLRKGRDYWRARCSAWANSDGERSAIAEVERLREALDAAEKVVEAAREAYRYFDHYINTLSRVVGPDGAAFQARLDIVRDALAEYDKLKEVE
jgi:hypothetical protein